MTIENKLHDSACKDSAVVMDLFIRTKGSTVVTQEIKIKGNRP